MVFYTEISIFKNKRMSNNLGGKSATHMYSVRAFFLSSLSVLTDCTMLINEIHIYRAVFK